MKNFIEEAVLWIMICSFLFTGMAVFVWIVGTIIRLLS